MGVANKNKKRIMGKMKRIWKFIEDENGLETVEWAVMAAIIVLGLVATISTLGDAVLGRFQVLESATSGS